MLDPPDAAPLPETLEAIERADLITVGPGSLYTSLITNLLVQGIPSALATARGIRVYICNLMTQANESLGLTASEHIERIYEHTRAPIFDYALVNTAPFSPETLARYAAEGASPIVADIERIEALGVRCIAGDFASEESVVRHDPAASPAPCSRWAPPGWPAGAHSSLTEKAIRSAGLTPPPSASTARRRHRCRARAACAGRRECPRRPACRGRLRRLRAAAWRKRCPGRDSRRSGSPWRAVRSAAPGAPPRAACFGPVGHAAQQHVLESHALAGAQPDPAHRIHHRLDGPLAIDGHDLVAHRDRWARSG